MEVYFSKRAEHQFEKIKKHIRYKWGLNVENAFVKKTSDFLDLLEGFAEIGSLELKPKNIRGFQLTKQTKVFYRIKKDKIVILSFFDVRQNPKKLKY